MPLTDELIRRKKKHSPFDSRQSNLYHTFGEEEKTEDEGFSLWSAVGSGMHHFLSSATMGGAEFFAPTKAWSEKTTSENVGAAFGEALGMFVPMGWIGKGTRGVAAGLKYGSKAIAKEAIDAATKKSIQSLIKEGSEEAVQVATKKGLEKGVYGDSWFGGKKLLYQHELGGDVANQVFHKDLLERTELALLSQLKKDGLEVPGKVVKEIREELGKGLAEGKHINSVSHWMQNRVERILGDKARGGLAQYAAKWTGEFAQDAVVLGIHGLVTNTLTSWARDDVEFAPGSTFGHALALSTIFPVIRSIPGGGERRIGELWPIVAKKYTKTNYKKVLEGPGGAKNVQKMIEIITGGKSYGNIFQKTKWTSRLTNPETLKKESYWIRDLLTANLGNKGVVDDMVDIAEQLQKSVGKIDIVKAWGKAYFRDTFLSAGTLTRMAVGMGAMNIDMFRDNMAGFKHLPAEELLTHMLIGAFMSRSRGGWARDPRSRRGDAKAAELDKMYQLMHLIGIDHSKVSDLIRVKNNADAAMGAHIGLPLDPTANEILEVFKQYEAKIAVREGKRPSQLTAEEKRGSPRTEADKIIEEWAYMRNMLGVMEGRGEFHAYKYSKLTESEKADFINNLKSIEWKGKLLENVTWNEFFSDFSRDNVKRLEQFHLDYFSEIGNESFDGAKDKILDLYPDKSTKKILHGGIEGVSDSNELAQLRGLLATLENKGLAEFSGNLQPLDITNNKAALDRLKIINDNFRKKLNNYGMGEGYDYYFNLGDVESNWFLRGWTEGRFVESQIRLGEFFTGQVKPENQQDGAIRASILSRLKDKNGSILRPNQYKVIKSKEDRTLSDKYNISDDLFNIAHGLYAGYEKTDPLSSEKIKLTEREAKNIIEAYKNMGMSISPDKIIDHISYIEARTYDRYGLSSESLSTVKILESEGLLVLDAGAKKIEVNSDNGIRKLADKENLTSEQKESLVEKYNELKSLLPQSHLVEKEMIIPMDPEKIVNVMAIENIFKALPKEYMNGIEKQFMKSLETESNKFLVEEAEGSLGLLNENLKNGLYKEAHISLENLKKLLPAKEFEPLFKDIYERIIKYETEGQLRELHLLELSDGSGNAWDALNKLIGKEEVSSDGIREMLIYIINKGKHSPYSAITEHSQLIDNLNSRIGNSVKTQTLDQLFESYLRTNSYSSLMNLMKGLNQSYVGGQYQRNKITNQHLADSYEKFVQNFTPNPQKDKLEVAGRYGMLDADNNISARNIELLRNNEYDKIKLKIQNKGLIDSEVDANLFYLSEIIRNTTERKAVALTEKFDPDGVPYLAREWISKDENLITLTPAVKVIDALNLGLIPIQKTGILKSKKYADITTEKVKAIFEGDIAPIIDVPSNRVFLDGIQKGGMLTPNDATRMRLIRPNFGDGGIRYIELSLGNAYAFVENSKTVANLRNRYRAWFSYTQDRINSNIRQGIESKGTLKNFNKTFRDLTDPENIIRAMYLSTLNPVGFDKLWTPTSIENFYTKTGYYGEALKLLKYSKLAEGGTLKSMPDVATLEKLAYSLASGLPNEKVRSLDNIIKALKDPNKQLNYGFISDEVVSSQNKLLIRNKVLDDVNKMPDIGIQGGLKKHLADRYSFDKNNYSEVLDKSSIDGSIYIDRDIRNLMLTTLNEPGHINGFKGSVSRTGEKNTEYIMFGKGLFIFDPEIATAMKNRKLRFLMGESAGKYVFGRSMAGPNIKGAVSRNTDFLTSIGAITNKNVIKGNLEGINLRFGGHLSNNAPVPQPYTNLLSYDKIVNVQEGYQMIADKINTVKQYSAKVKSAAHEEIMQAIIESKASTSNVWEQNIASFAEQMYSLGYNSRNEIVRESILKVFEEQTLPTILKPRNAKFTNPFLGVDLKSETSKAVGVYDAKGNKVGSSLVHIGESLLSIDDVKVPVDSINELAFSIRSKSGVDHLIRYQKPEKGKPGEFETYSAINEWSKSGYLPRRSIQGIENTTEVPKEYKKIIKALGNQIKSRRIKSLWEAQDYIEKQLEYKFKDNPRKFGLIIKGERIPRKGPSDFVPLRVRARKKAEKDLGSAGTILKSNSKDVSTNFQGDHDGDKLRKTHDFSKSGLWDLLKQSYFLVANNESYAVEPAPPRKANIFGVEVSRGVLSKASTKETDTIHDLKNQISLDQRNVSKIIGIQGALTWAGSTGLKINGVGMNTKFEYSPADLVKNGGLYRRMEKINQSVVDFIAGMDPKLLTDGVNRYLFGTGEKNKDYRGEFFSFSGKNPRIERDILKEVLSILRAPHSLFNQVYTEAGAQNPNAWNILEHYTKIRKFFYDPNTYVMNRLLRKYKREGHDMNSVLNELAPLFYETEGGAKVQVNSMGEFKSLMLQGKIRPNRNVIKFDNTSVNKNLKKSPIGLIMDEIVSSKMYKNEEIDLAWQHRDDLRNFKIQTEGFLEEIMLLRTLGLKDSELIGQGEKVFDIGRSKHLRYDEKSSMMYDLLNSEASYLTGKMDYQLGQRFSNDSVVRGLANRINDVQLAKQIIEFARGSQVLETVSKNTSKYIKRLSNKKDGTFRSIYNKKKRPIAVYPIIGDLAPGGVPNYDALKKPIMISPKRSKQLPQGNYLVLENPIIGSRISRERTIDGYSWHYVYNSLPMFTDRHIFTEYLQQASDVGTIIQMNYSNALTQFKQGQAFSKEIFLNAFARRNHTLDSYFGLDLSPRFNAEKVSSDVLVPELRREVDKSFIYYKAKMLLKPEVVFRQYVESEKMELPLMKLNKNLFKEVHKYLLDRGHNDVAQLLSKEYNQARDYISGWTNEMTFNLEPSPLFLDKWAIPEHASNTLRTLLEHNGNGFDLSFKTWMQNNGIGMYEGNIIRSVDEKFEIREVKNMFHNWKQTGYDKRRSCR